MLTELVREAKQAAWTVPHRPTHDALDALFGFLVGQAAAVADAEAAIDGRSPDMVSPSQHRSRWWRVRVHAGTGNLVLCRSGTKTG